MFGGRGRLRILLSREFGYFESASPGEPVIFDYPSRAAVRCGSRWSNRYSIFSSAVDHPRLVS